MIQTYSGWDSELWRLSFRKVPPAEEIFHQTQLNKAVPENRPLEKEIPNLETTIFTCELLVSGRVPLQGGKEDPLWK